MFRCIGEKSWLTVSRSASSDANLSALLLLACLLPSRPDDSLALIGRAIAAAPERPDLVWLQAQVCQEVTRCDPEPIERHLRELDPSNGAGWMGALARANSSRNDEAMDAALAAIGHSDRVDIYLDNAHRAT